MTFPLYPGLRKGRGLLCALLLTSPAAFGQSEAAPAKSETPSEVVTKIDRLTKSLEQTQVELAESRTEIQQLRAALEEVLTRMNAMAPLPATAQQPVILDAPDRGADPFRRGFYRGVYCNSSRRRSSRS